MQLSSARHSCQRGLSLIELMIALVVGLIALAGTMSIYITTVRGSTFNLQLARLNQELRTAADLMAYEVRRAGYSGALADPANNPFISRAPTLRDVNIPVASCMLFTYDNDEDGAAGVADLQGFRLNGGAVEMVTGVTAGTVIDTTSCDAAALTWEAVSDVTAVVITRLQFSMAGSKCLNATQTDAALSLPTPQPAVTWTSTSATVPACDNPPAASVPVSGDVLIETRFITIELDGRTDPANEIDRQTLQLAETVRLPNDRIFTVP